LPSLILRSTAAIIEVIAAVPSACVITNLMVGAMLLLRAGLATSAAAGVEEREIARVTGHDAAAEGAVGLRRGHRERGGGKPNERRQDRGPDLIHTSLASIERL
jgi:hypothetical protein